MNRDHSQEEQAIWRQMQWTADRQRQQTSRPARPHAQLQPRAVQPQSQIRPSRWQSLALAVAVVALVVIVAIGRSLG